MKRAITPAQCRAARALLGWSREDLAKASGCPVRTIADFELGNRSPRKSTTTRIITTLLNAGIIFIDENSEFGPGVRTVRQR